MDFVLKFLVEVKRPDLKRYGFLLCLYANVMNK